MSGLVSSGKFWRESNEAVVLESWDEPNCEKNAVEFKIRKSVDNIKDIKKETSVKNIKPKDKSIEKSTNNGINSMKKSEGKKVGKSASKQDSEHEQHVEKGVNKLKMNLKGDNHK